LSDVDGDLLETYSDIWSEWLLHRRHAGNSTTERLVCASVERFANRVLDGARLKPGMTLADIGTGDGLVALGAIDRIGPSLRVLLTDISAPMLDRAKALAIETEVCDQCTFIQGSADRLEGIADVSVDVVTTRAVLAYVADKPAALREFHRVLKPGGRLSIAEPIFRDDALETIALRKTLDARPADSQDAFLRLLHRWKAAQFPDTVEHMAQIPITNYSERDLVRFAQGAGFGEIHLEFHVDIVPSYITSWDVLLGISPHPWSPSLGAILEKQFSPEEQQQFERALRPNIEGGQSVTAERVAYLTARRPAV
jgi:ubiquinone/menaquinone biosynthesis C-methylase UbiE